MSLSVWGNLTRKRCFRRLATHAILLSGVLGGYVNNAHFIVTTHYDQIMEDLP